MARTHAFVYVNIDQVAMTHPQKHTVVYVNIDQVVMIHTHKHTVDVQNSELMFRILNS